MNTNITANYCDRLVSTLSAPLSAYALIWLAGSPVAGTVQCNMNILRMTPQSRAALEHALDIEKAFVDAIAAFEDQEEPRYSTPALRMPTVSERLGLRRVLCAVIVTEDGTVHAGRNYDEVEVTRLETVCKTIQSLRSVPPQSLH